MDIVTLSINMDKNPSCYRDEYKKQIYSFTHLLELQKQPEKLIRQTMDFLLRYYNIDPSLSTVILESVKKAKTYKLKSALIAANLTLCYKKLTSSYDVIGIILEEVHDCTKYIHNIKSVIQFNDIEIIKKFYKIGNDKQKLFCYYFICFLFTKYKLKVEEDVCTGLFENQKVKKYCYKFFLETIDMSLLSKNCKKYGEKLYKDITGRKDEREHVISKMKVFVLFRNRFSLKNTIVPLSLSMMDPEKDDVKDLMEIIVDSVNEEEVMKVIKIIAESFCSPFKDDDMICYGLNLMRGLYMKFYKNVEDCVDSSESEQKEEENVTELLENIKESILSYIECFKGLKTKSIAYAYRSVINVIKKKKNNGRPLSFISKKFTKEEKQEIYGKKNNKQTKIGKNRKKCKNHNKNIKTKRK